MRVSDEGELSQEAGLLEVAVREVAEGVVSRHEAPLDVAREGCTPEVGAVVGAEVDAAHSGPGGVRGPKEGGEFGYELREVRRASAEAGREAGEVPDSVTQRGRDADSGRRGGVEGVLKGAEEAGGTGDALADEAESA